jgi:hypothetical protein
MFTENLHKTLCLAAAYAGAEPISLHHALAALTHDQDAQAVFQSCRLSIDELRQPLAPYFREVSDIPCVTEPVLDPDVDIALSDAKTMGPWTGETTGATFLFELFTRKAVVDFFKNFGLAREDVGNYLEVLREPPAPFSICPA